MDHNGCEMCWKEISITEIEGIRIGNAQNEEAMTGVTVILFDKPNTGGVDVSGGGPASREVHLLSPLTNPVSLNALVFSGGSAFGLDASTGVMNYLEQHGMGFYVLNAVIPLVCQSCIFDFGIGSALIRPDAEMGYAACIDAEHNRPQSGNVGAGTGATVGKINGIEQSQKSGIGYYAVQMGALKLGAVVVVNACGDVFDDRTGQKLGGVLNPQRTAFVNGEAELYGGCVSVVPGANTTLGAIITNGSFDQAEMNKIASMARAAFGRCIRPVGTMFDGDMIYAISTGEVKADLNLVGTLGATVLSAAIRDAVTSSAMPEEVFMEKIRGKKGT